MIKYLFSALMVWSSVMSGQEKGVISGAFETNANVFLRDSAINAINTPQYDHSFGGEAWLNLIILLKILLWEYGFDMFNNSNLRNPTDSTPV
ncbi:MAG: hypothetical protein IPJ13_19575 [Saprospiraceae bacterium]|nr:hypothetical protein [Saprospiraceae bacterium]